MRDSFLNFRRLVFSANFLPITFLTIYWFACVVLRIKFAGLVYGLDYGNFHPDGANYTFRALVWSGDNQVTASERVADWYNLYGLKTNVVSEMLLPMSNPVWQVIQPRWLYPLLSVPFVKLLGINGMLVVPAFSLLVLMLGIFTVAQTKLNREFSLFLAISVTLSTTVMRWMISDCTDSLFVALFTLVVIVFSKGTPTSSGKLLILFLVVLTSFTRFALVIWILISIVAVRKFGLKFGVSVFGVATLAAIPTLFSGDSIAKIPGSGNISSQSEITAFPITLLKVIIVEFSQLFVLDRILFLFLIFSVWLVIHQHTAISSNMLFFVFIAVALLGGINGVFGVNFRYQLPAIPFMYWALIDYINVQSGSFKKRN